MKVKHLKTGAWQLTLIVSADDLATITEAITDQLAELVSEFGCHANIPKSHDDACPGGLAMAEICCEWIEAGICDEEDDDDEEGVK